MYFKAKYCAKWVLVKSLLLFFMTSLSAQEDEIVEFNSIPIEEVMLKGRELPGVRFLYTVTIPSQSDLSGYALSKSGRGNIWTSDTLNFYLDALAIKDTVQNTFELEGEIQSLLFDEKIDRDGLQAYFDNLVRNELYILEAEEEAEERIGELVVLGNKIPFKPYYKLKIQVLTDIRMIILITFLSFFVLAAIILVVVIFVIKTKKRNRDVLVRRFKDLCYEPLSNFLFEHSLEEIQQMDKYGIVEKLPKNLMHKPLFKDVMIQEIISLNKNMKGEFKQKLKLIYRKLELDKHTLQKLEAKRWDIITTGIVEINEMDVVEAEGKVMKFVNHQNFYIRSNAVATLLNISNDTDLNVLADQEYPLSRWQQMIYYRIIRYTKDKRNIGHLLESKNQSVRVFGIKLIRYLGLIDQLEKLLGMFEIASEAEKIEMIRCFNLFGFIDSLERVYAVLKSDNQTLVLESIKLIENLGEKISTTALFEFCKLTSDFEAKKAAMRAIYKLDPSIFEAYFSESEDEVENKINLHLKDPVLANV
ncbi:hypothetical protein EGN73_02765 [Arthrospiribacter ruber]|uniref:HEAT repeat domain-containing protein n=1 Tax=Arthrospiribacter ruber TaxID=2487934 RepID=A0A951IUR3_9BACT|nr:hypothetical protein [Arthrospiribacter ruber]